MRSLLFGGDGRESEGFGLQISYDVTKTADGGFEMDADRLVDLTSRTLDAICGQMRAAKVRAAAVAIDTFWHSVAGIDAQGKPATPILHLFDTRSADAARRLAQKIDDRAQHARTGCVLHPSYYPAKLLWLSETRPDVFRRVSRWVSFGEYLFLRLFGDVVTSTSMVSGTGLWNQNENDYDAEILSVLPARPEQFTPKAGMDEPRDRLREEFRTRWAELDGIPWFPALGDGACNNVGSGCTTRERFALMAGTSGAMRAVLPEKRVTIPPGLWCYRVDPRRFVLGGALSDGGSVHAWARDRLQLPADPEMDSQIGKMRPGEHGLTVLPFFAGERSTGWRADARAAIIGLSAHTTTLEIARSLYEAVSLRFRAILDLMVLSIGRPKEVIGSGGGLLHSGAWSGIMADALGQRVTACVEKEATSRGAALLALERITAIRDAGDLPPRLGDSFEPSEEHRRTYEEMLSRQQRLYTKLFEEKW